MEESLRISVPEKMNMAWYTCDRWVEEGKGDRAALLFDDRKISWKELQAEVNRIGNGLMEIGVGKGNRVLLRTPNTPTLYASIIACMKIGAVPIPSSTLFRVKELEYILNNSRAVAAIADSEVVEPLDEARATIKTLKHLIVIGEPKKDQVSFENLVKNKSTELKCAEMSKNDEAFMLYTSGTTGPPKGIVHAHRWLMWTGDPIGKLEMHLKPGDVTLSVSEIAWMYPFGCNCMYPLYLGATVGVHKGRFDPERAFSHIEKYRATHYIANPTIYKRMLLIEDAEKKYDYSSLKMGLSSGETLPPDVFNSWRERFGCEIYDSIGQTEIHIFCCTRPGIVKMSSMGKPFPGVPPTTVVDDEGGECPKGAIGYLAISAKHPGLALRYEGREKEWAERFKAGWYLTGDLAYVDEEGFFFFASRSDDMIKSRGYLVGPKEIEDTLQGHKAVLEAAVIGAPDPTLGQKVKAFVVLRPGFQPSEELAKGIREMVLKTIAPFKAPKEIEFVESLPKTVTEKILRRDLRKLEVERKAKAEEVPKHAYGF